MSETGRRGFLGGLVALVLGPTAIKPKLEPPERAAMALYETHLRIWQMKNSADLEVARIKAAIPEHWRGMQW